MLGSLLVVLAIGVDPRVELANLEQEGRDQEALVLAERVVEDSPDQAAALGIDYLVGRLLQKAGRGREAVGAYARVMRSCPALHSYALLRVAQVQTSLGHPELASGLLVSLLQRSPPSILLRPTERLLVEALDRGGDCRVLDDLALDRLPAPTRRRLSLYRIACNPGSEREQATALLDLLREDGTDLAASLASRRLVRLPHLELDAEAADVLGKSLHYHREFESAARQLERAAADLPEELERTAQFETLYQLVRSWFWEGDLPRAVVGFGNLAQRARHVDDRARALFQQGRSLELMGEWGTASASYRRAYLADPNGSAAAAALLAALRVDWRAGHEQAALEILALLPTRPEWRPETARAALYLASSDLVRHRHDRAGPWLRMAEVASGHATAETSYWRGRLEEESGNAAAAAERYLEAIGLDPYHPLAAAARVRLGSDQLRAVGEQAAIELAGSHRVRDLDAAWRVLGSRHPSGRAARAKLEERAMANRTIRDIETATPVPTAAWPLWQDELETPEETLLALGLWHEAGPAVLEHFPPSHPALALTASAGLYRSGDVPRSIYVAEIVADRIGDRVPESAWPRELRARLYPQPYTETIDRVARSRGVDRSLLLALLREESRFDPDAVSGAAARGMAQFVYPTARPLARRVGLGRITPDDLADPRVSIQLAAAYVAELLALFDGSVPSAIAAYNAGDRQVTLWRAHCYSRDSAELITKIGFSETRAYVDKVLRARARYRELYGPGPAGPDQGGVGH